MGIINDEIRQRVNIREVYRYLGCGTDIPGDGIRTMAGEVLDSLISAADPRNIYRIYDCRITGTKIVMGDGRDAGRGVVFQSRNLSDNLRGCRRVILFAATLGIGADKLLHRYEALNMAKAAAAQACGAACIETYCDILQERICEEVSAGGDRLYLRPRFSPGYGDLPLQSQRAVFSALECTKHIGLTLTDSLLMYPTKSVTAFIGLTDNPRSCHISRCGACDNAECGFRGGIE